MAALTGPRNTPRREPEFREPTVATGVTVQQGGIAVLEAGVAKPGRTATGLVAIGMFEETVAGDGVRRAKVRRGCFRFGNSAAGDLIAAADIGGTAYIVDDQTVAKTHATNTRSAAGKIFDVDAFGVWVELG